MSWDCIAETAESIIVSFPHVFNRFRDVSMHYDVMEAYTLLKDNNCFPTEIYDFTEELPYQDDALSPCGKEQLLEAITSMASQWPLIGFYTCDKFIFLVGSYDSDLFILDTHDVPIQAGNNCTLHTKLLLGQESWNRKESSYLPLNQPPKFYTYILEKVYCRKSTVLKAYNT